MGQDDNRNQGATPKTDESPLARIELKQVKMSREQVDAAKAAARPRPAQPAAPEAKPAAPEAKPAAPKGKSANLMNRLVPYLDLFERLEDHDLARIARVPVKQVAGLRQQVNAVTEALDPFTDLLPRLKDEELIRLTGATPKTIRFWRLCQPWAGARKRSMADGQGAKLETPADFDPSESVVAAISTQSSASMHMASITGTPFPGNEGALTEPDESPLSVSLLDEDDDGFELDDSIDD